MLRFKCTLLFIVYCVSVANSSSVSFITKCTPTDNDCVFKSSQIAFPYFVKGMPELNIPSADPIGMDDYSANKGDLLIDFSNIKVTGLSQGKLVKVARDADKSTIEVVFETPINVTGKYKVSGQILSVKVEGDDQFQFKTDKVVVNVLSYLESFEKDGKKYYRVNDFEYKYEIKDRLSINLENLFGGDKEKADPVLKVLNEGWEFLVADIGDPIIRNVINVIVTECINVFFENIPAEDLEL